MKKITGLCAGTFLLLTGVGGGIGMMAAQDGAADMSGPPKVLVIGREYTKPGKDGAAHEKTESAFVTALDRGEVADALLCGDVDVGQAARAVLLRV